MTTEIQRVQISAVVEPSVIKKLYQDAEDITKEALKLKVDSYDKSNKATDLATIVNKGKQRIEKARKDILQDTKDFTNTINGLFKPITQMCDDAISHLNRERSNFNAEERRKQAEAIAKARAEELRRQKISIAQGGDGSNIKPVEKPEEKLQIKTTQSIRRVPDREAIKKAIDSATLKIEEKVKCPLEIPGVSIFHSWTFEIYDNQAVPDEYRKDSFVNA